MKKTQFIADPDKYGIDRGTDNYILADESVLRIDNYKVLSNRYSFANNGQVGEEYIKTQEYISDLSKRIIQHYCEKFNKTLRLDFSQSQWMLIMGEWFNGFLFDAYDCYCRIKNSKGMLFMIRNGGAKSGWMDQKELGLDEVNSPKFRGDFYCDIFNALSMDVRSRKIKLLEKIDKKTVKEKEIWKYRIEWALKNPTGIIDKIRTKIRKNNNSIGPLRQVDFRGEVLVVQSRMPKETEEYLCKISNNAICFVNGDFFWNHQRSVIRNIKYDFDLREKTINGNIGRNEFENILDRLLIKYMPISFLEGMPALYDEAIRLIDKWDYRKIYHSAHYSELFLICCAIMKEKGVVLCDIQHSAVYGGVYCFGFKEYKIWDRFLTWGWKSDHIPYGNLRPVAISRCPKPAPAGIQSKGKILFAVNAPELNEMGRGWLYSKYTIHQMQFIDNLSDKDRHKLVIRTPAGRELSDLRNQCEKKYPYIKFEYIQEKTFAESLAESDLLVCDYYGSPHIEALLLGYPFVMFEGAEIIIHNPKLNPFFTRMSELGIYFKSGRDLAKEISKQNDWKEWLNRTEVKELFDVYKKAMTNCDKNINDLWYREFIGD